ncbi:MAG: sugar phosphate nucleotidyltransferase [Spirochaetes bacterium]|jgi:mannose-1-phosphate guanylyltransferase|nr:sugar phosphate nucleotidyltransferase [Spirochaetota bacterium]
MNIIPVIMAGGAGTRLWPLSRDDKPKQYHNLSGEGTLLEGTIARLLPLDPDEVLIVTSKKYDTLTANELCKFDVKGTILCEPRPRNTAAAVLYAALYLRKLAGDPTMIILPADHFIKKKDEFVRIMKMALKQAEKGSLVTVGIKPTYPETGYGYIKSVEESGEIRVVDRFVEKPDLEKAKQYIDSGNYYWNSGIFIWKTSAILKAFEKLLPGHVKAFAPFDRLNAEEIASDNEEIWKIKKEIFDSVEPISVDFGILENSDNRVLIPADIGWADLGSWKAIDDILDPDAEGNRSPDMDKAIFVESDNCSVFSENLRISVVGLSNIVVIEAGGEILVIDKDSAQDVRKVVEIVKKKA